MKVNEYNNMTYPEMLKWNDEKMSNYKKTQENNNRIVIEDCRQALIRLKGRVYHHYLNGEQLDEILLHIEYCVVQIKQIYNGG